MVLSLLNRGLKHAQWLLTYTPACYTGEKGILDTFSFVILLPIVCKRLQLDFSVSLCRAHALYGDWGVHDTSACCAFRRQVGTCWPSWERPAPERAPYWMLGFARVQLAPTYIVG